MLTHHKLKVYGNALSFCVRGANVASAWGRRHAVTDQFATAAESIVIIIAEAARLRSGPEKSRTLDYALGSTLECAACLDLATLKQLLDRELASTEKRHLLEITRMLVGLRKAWQSPATSEEPVPYRAHTVLPGLEALFHHESLRVYQAGLDFVRWFVELPGAKDLSDRLCKEIDRPRPAWC